MASNSHDLVLVGPIGELGSIYIKKIKRMYPHLTNNIHFIGAVSKSLLSNIYANADVFCCTSYEEGFCLPLLEAMYFGKPIVASNISTIAEVCHDAILYADPSDYKSFAQKIHCLITDHTVRTRLKDKAIRRAELFSWEKTFKKILYSLQYN